MMPLPLKIRQLRERLGLSQAEFALKIGVKQQNIDYNEQEKTAAGQERTVSFQIIDKICAAFGYDKIVFINGSVEDILNSTKNFSGQDNQLDSNQSTPVRPNTELVLEKKVTLEDYIELRVKLAQAEQLARDMLAQNNMVLQQNHELVKILDNRLNSTVQSSMSRSIGGYSQAANAGDG